MEYHIRCSDTISESCALPYWAGGGREESWALPHWVARGGSDLARTNNCAFSTSTIHVAADARGSSLAHCTQCTTPSACSTCSSISVRIRSLSHIEKALRTRL